MEWPRNHRKMLVAHPQEVPGGSIGSFFVGYDHNISVPTNGAAIKTHYRRAGGD